MWVSNRGSKTLIIIYARKKYKKKATRAWRKMNFV